MKKSISFLLVAITVTTSNTLQFHYKFKDALHDLARFCAQSELKWVRAQKVSVPSSEHVFQGVLKNIGECLKIFMHGEPVEKSAAVKYLGIFVREGLMIFPQEQIEMLRLMMVPHLVREVGGDDRLLPEAFRGEYQELVESYVDQTHKLLYPFDNPEMYGGGED